MSTPRTRRPRAVLPPWLAAISRGQLARADGKPVKVTFQLTAAERAGLTRVLDAAKRQRAQLSEGDICRVALDQLLAAFERFQVDPEPAGGFCSACGAPVKQGDGHHHPDPWTIQPIPPEPEP